MPHAGIVERPRQWTTFLLGHYGANFRGRELAQPQPERKIVFQALHRTVRNIESQFVEASEKPLDSWKRRGMGRDAAM